MVTVTVTDTARSASLNLLFFRECQFPYVHVVLRNNSPCLSQL